MLRLLKIASGASSVTTLMWPHIRLLSVNDFLHLSGTPTLV
jgi:hypothetical protein